MQYCDVWGATKNEIALLHSLQAHMEGTPCFKINSPTVVFDIIKSTSKPTAASPQPDQLHPHISVHHVLGLVAGERKC